MDGVQALIFKAECRPATSWANTAWTAYTVVVTCSDSKKLLKIGAARHQILRLKCIKFDFCWGCLRPRLGGLQRSPTALAVFKGAYGSGTAERRGTEG